MESQDLVSLETQDCMEETNPLEDSVDSKRAHGKRSASRDLLPVQMLGIWGSWELP